MTDPALASVRVVFFDAVGTLLHPEPSAADVYAAVGARLGSQLDRATIRQRFATAFRRQEELDRVHGLVTDEPREVARWRAIVAEVLDDVRAPEECFQTLYRHFAQPAAWRVDSEAAGVLAELAVRGYRLGVASNFDHRLHDLVAGLPGLGAIREVLVSSEVGWRKPAPAFFHALCQRAGLPPAQILLVGDDLDNDYLGARAAGIAALLLDPRGRAAVPPPAVLSRLADLPARLPGPVGRL